MEILSSRDQWWLTQCEAALLAEGIPARFHAISDGVVTLEVEDHEQEHVNELLAEQLAFELEKLERQKSTGPWVPLLLQPSFAFALCFALLILGFHLFTVASGQHGELVARASGSTAALWRGEWWRFFTAMSLHADLAHALGNAFFLVVLAWASSERVGPGITLGFFVITAAAGFVLSVMTRDIAATIGASGGLFGLLGVTSGHGMRHRRERDFRTRERLRMLGAGVLLLAFTAFGPETNIRAHVGGFAAGVLCGALGSSALISSRLAQVIFGVAGMGALGLAWLKIV